MNVSYIRSVRERNNRYSYHLLYEWEDDLSQLLGIPLLCESRFVRLIARIDKKIKKDILSPFITNGKNQMFFELCAKTIPTACNNRYFLPMIVDFHTSEDELSDFYKAYDKNPAVLISNREVIEFLDKHNAPLKYYHFPLSLSDRYRITEDTRFEKKYDLVLMGRQNPFFEECIHRYAEKYPDFTYVVRRGGGDKQFLYYTNTGEFVGDMALRKDYMPLLRQSRVGLYSTPGIDGGEKRTKGFNQVTPRFLELIASGCHLMLRYTKNADTDFYRFADFCKSIETYEEFETVMTEALKTEAPMKQYADYLQNHYTSVRAEQLKGILELI